MYKTAKLAVFDLDNCVFDDRHRQPLIDLSLPLHRRYVAYHEAMYDDRPYPFGIGLVKFLHDQGWFILFNTARPVMYRDQTMQQLELQGIKPNMYDMAMRLLVQEGKDTAAIKNENLECYIKKAKMRGIHFNVVSAFDDRPDVIENYGVIKGETFACVNGYVLTGNSIIYHKDKTSMAQAKNVFKGRPVRDGLGKHEGDHSANRGRIRLAPGQWLDVAMSQGAKSWLWHLFGPDLDLSNGVTTSWRESDFPGAQEYNAKRKIDLKTCGQTTPLTEEQKAFIDNLMKEPVPNLNFRCKASPVFDVDKSLDHVSAFLNVPKSVLLGWDKGNGDDTAISVGYSARLREYEKTHVDIVSASKPKTAADILGEAAATFRDRNAVYKDNAGKVGEVMAVLFPDGVTLKTEADHKFYHLFELLIVKLTRFTNSGLHHEDSIHDLMVYAAMLEAIGVDNHDIKTD